MKQLLYFILFLCVLATQASAQQVRYVMEGTSGNGSSWSNASGDLRSILTASQSGDEVWVASGTYTPTVCSPCDRAELNKSFDLPPGVALRGGFSGTETSPNQRSSTPDSTILSGEIEARVDTVGSHSVVLSIAPTQGTLLEGFFITRGRALDLSIGDSDKSASGSLLYISAQDTVSTYKLQVKNCHFYDGQAWGYGGAIAVEASFNRKSAISVEDCSFSNCEAIEAGGAVSISVSFGGHDESSFKNCKFTNNKSQEIGGGAFFLSTAEGGEALTSFSSLSFRQNQSFGNGGALLLYSKTGYSAPVFDELTATGNSGDFGGAIYLDGSYGGMTNPSFLNARLDSNTSVNAGGSFYGMAAYEGNVNYSFENSSFSHNLSGESGGAILVNAIEGQSRPYYRDCRFMDNRATLYGGAIYNLGRSGVCSPTLINCIIARNVGSSAGGMYCLGSNGGRSNPLIINCAFIENQANVGGGLYSNGNDSTGTAEPFVVNTIFHGNRASNGATLRTIHARPRLLNCSFEEANCAALVSGFGGSPQCLGGNFFSTPNPFTDLANQDYSLASNSLLIDAGVDSSLLTRAIYEDNTLNARLRGAAVDIGPIESASAAILWSELALTDSLQICENTEVTLTPEFSPAYPASYAWVFAGDTLARTVDLGPFIPTTSGAYKLVARTFGEILETNVEIAILPLLTTELKPSPTNIDTICLDSTTILAVDISSVGNSFQVNWMDSTGAILSNSVSYEFTAQALGDVNFSVEVLFSGNCLDVPARSQTISSYVKNCQTSGTQDIVYQTLRLSPNPVSDLLHLPVLPENSQYIYTIFNTNGHKLIFGTNSAHNTNIDVSSLPQGFYILVIESEQTFYQSSFAKL